MLKLHPTELARQLTLLESDIVKRIKPPELMQSAWKKPNKKELAPGISELIAWFNKVRRARTHTPYTQSLRHTQHVTFTLPRNTLNALHTETTHNKHRLTTPNAHAY